MTKSKLSARVALWVIMAGVLLVVVAGIALADIVVIDPNDNGSFLGLPALTPGGPNVYRAVLYNHGGKGPNEEGGDPEKVVEMLAEEGFIAYAKHREEFSVEDTLVEVQEGLSELMNLSPAQLQGRSIMNGTDDPGVSLIGYSRGALLSLRLAEVQQDSNGVSRKIDRVVLMAMAPGAVPPDGSWTEGGATSPSQFTTADTFLSDGSISPPSTQDNIGLIDAASTEFFMIAAENDQPTDNPHNNLVDLMTTANQRMVDRSGTAVSSTLKIYDSWMSPQTGHNLFMKVSDGGQDLVNEQGYYWYDVVRFLKNNPIDTTYTVLVPEPNCPTLCTSAARGDLNCDAIVDIVDMAILAVNWLEGFGETVRCN